ncbi:MAG: hypothetical protein E6J86_14645 [Deltaproteobacteria bacterium]|nr:MAG: hypothetical protein E6J86_14645 [Deltaproteobacteria bacterium]
MIKKAVSTAAAVFLLELPAALLAETSVRRPQTAMMTKPVVCRVLQEARGKSGEDLAAVVENDGASLAASNYELPTIIPGDPPIACYRARVDPSKLRRGAR